MLIRNRKKNEKVKICLFFSKYKNIGRRRKRFLKSKKNNIFYFKIEKIGRKWKKSKIKN